MGPSAATLALVGHLIQHTLALLGGDGLEDQQTTTPMARTAVSAQDPWAVQRSALQTPDIQSLCGGLHRDTFGFNRWHFQLRQLIMSISG